MAIVFMFVFVPSMTSQYGPSAGPIELPWWLAIIVFVVKVIASPAFLTFAVALGVIGYIVFRWYITTPQGKYWWDGRILKFGMYGQAVSLMEQGDVFLTYSRLDNAGTETHEAWALAVETVGNLVMKEAFTEIRDRRGVMLWQAFRDTKRIDQRATDLVEAAEKAGGRHIPNRLERIGRAFLSESLDLFQRAAQQVGQTASLVSTIFIVSTMVTAVFLTVAHLMQPR
jgi:type II secretory pathway component PulF